VKPALAAIAFLTRIPVARFASFESSDVSRSAAWFPLIGLLLGAIYGGLGVLLRPYLPLVVVAVLLVAIDALLTGALHLDGLADTVDGFGGGKDREDILRIMRDHNIGSYGAVAVILVVALKVSSYSSLLTHGDWFRLSIVVPTLGRWSMLLLTATLPYARESRSVIMEIGRSALIWGTLVTLGVLLFARSQRTWTATGAVAIVTAVFGVYCRRRISGITGDALGANLQLSESAALLAYLWIS
jgi:adenosylcobinamide-GDP ribazoletransferase